jgi:hypothetical protein
VNVKPDFEKPLYIGVREARIKAAQPVLNEVNARHLARFIWERYEIRKKKDVFKLPKPWTYDPILRDWKFCNVKREHDRESRYLIGRVCDNPSLTLRQKIENIVAFRIWNLGRTFDFFSFPYAGEAPIGELASRKPDFNPYTGAFMVSGITLAMKNDAEFGQFESAHRPIAFYNRFVSSGMAEQIAASASPVEAVQLLRSIKGIGDFLSYQMWVDCTYIREFQQSENDFVVAGPGCRNGMDLVFESKGGLNYDELLFWCRDCLTPVLEGYAGTTVSSLMNDLPESERHIGLMSFENLFCEISRYIRFINGGTEPKVRYEGRW